VRGSALGFLVEHLHRDGHEPLELLVGGTREQRFRPALLLAFRVAIEQATQEADERDAMQLGAALRHGDVLLAAEQGLEAVRVAQRLCRERCDRLREAHVGVAERLGVTFGAEEDRADHRALPPDGQHDDRAHVSHLEGGLDALELRVVRRVGDEHRLAALERALELRIAVQVDEQVPNRRILVARDEAHLVPVARQEDRAAIEAERLAELSRDRLQDVDEVQRRRDLLQDVDDRGEVIALALDGRESPLEARQLVSRGRRLRALGRRIWLRRECVRLLHPSGIGGR
jgi:hypothetical protein